MDTFKLRIVTPAKAPLELQAQVVTLNCVLAGQLSLYAHHMDLIADVDITPLEIQYNGHVSYYALGGGVLSIDQKTNTISLICNSIEAYDEIDLTRAQESKVRAEKLLGLKEEKTPREALELERQLKRAINRIKVKTEYRNI